MFDIDWRGLILPFAYLLVLGGTFATFSTVYRKRKAAQNANLSPWFPPHLPRNIYLSLLHLEPEPEADTKKEKALKTPPSLLRAALLRRAVEDIHRIVKIRQAKQACSSLLQRGSVGDDLWQRFQRAERDMEEELRDVVTEANALVPNWGQYIFQTANAIAGNMQLRSQLDEIQGRLPAEKAWWAEQEARRTAAAVGTLATPAVLTPTAPAPSEGSLSAATAASSRPSTAKSEDRAALDAPAPNTPSKKKKGKK